MPLLSWSGGHGAHDCPAGTVVPFSHRTDVSMGVDGRGVNGGFVTTAVVVGVVVADVVVDDGAGTADVVVWVSVPTGATSSPRDTNEITKAATAMIATTAAVVKTTSGRRYTGSGGGACGAMTSVGECAAGSIRPRKVWS